MQVMFNSRDGPRHASPQASSHGAKWCAGHSKFVGPLAPRAWTLGDPPVRFREYLWFKFRHEPCSGGRSNCSSLLFWPPRTSQACQAELITKPLSTHLVEVFHLR